MKEEDVIIRVQQYIYSDVIEVLIPPRYFMAEDLAEAIKIAIEKTQEVYKGKPDEAQLM